MDRAMILKKLDTLRTRPSRIADLLREPRQMVVGGTMANAMGLQLARAVKDRALWHARPSRVTRDTRAAYETLQHDGVVVIPNFLPEDEFRRVSDEYKASQLDSASRWTSFGQNVGANEIFISDHLERYPATARAFRDSEFLLDLAAAVSRRSRTYKPHVSFFTVSKPDPTSPHVDLDYNQFAHADRHYAFVKAFFYINDVGEADAPFSYARGTHKLSLARARFEYQYSVRYSRVRAQGYQRTRDDLLANESLRECADRLMSATGCPCHPIVGRANTLIVANNQGFHKRGELRSGGRATVNIDFKYLESPAQWMYPVLKHLYVDP
jgi:hypothetical protein